MTITQRWVKEPHVLEFIYSDDLSSEELIKAIKQNPELYSSPVSILITLAPNVQMPTQLINTMLSSNTIMDFIKHPNTRSFAIIGASKMLQLSAQTIFRGEKVLFTDNREQAITFLCKQT